MCVFDLLILKSSSIVDVMILYGSLWKLSKTLTMGRVLGRSTDHNIIIVFALYRTHVK
ncbi:hypothetical protein L9Z41_09720 [Leptospira noguchii]|uniref:hypothetical protein n=1 Tax=Leptospira noguchii TaxID=28182 RepID=UPI001F06D12C|nr:hypothetical protein [Leptospira noguchii]MCH1912230.1 hypothetical protein [Leptospira noguchii]MCH1915908.1 hypothetical protein [Leptospira noguchii]UOG63333.1 hypothetical protein MAL04_13605 [Leptospira noguchii]